MFLFWLFSFVEELAHLDIVFLLNNGNDLPEGGSVPRILIIDVRTQIFAHDTLEVHVRQILNIWLRRAEFLLFTRNLRGLYFTRIFDVLILTNIF